jgi:hypothetical protein
LRDGQRNSHALGFSAANKKAQQGWKGSKGLRAGVEPGATGRWPKTQHSCPPLTPLTPTTLERVFSPSEPSDPSNPLVPSFVRSPLSTLLAFRFRSRALTHLLARSWRCFLFTARPIVPATRDHCFSSGEGILDPFLPPDLHPNPLLFLIAHSLLFYVFFTCRATRGFVIPRARGNSALLLHCSKKATYAFFLFEASDYPLDFASPVPRAADEFYRELSRYYYPRSRSLTVSLF